MDFSFLFRLQIVVGALFHDLATLQGDDVIALWQELELVGHEQPSFALHQIDDAILKDLPSDFGVQCGQRIVQNHNLRVGIGGSRDAHSLLLTSRKVDPLLSDFHHVATVEQLEIVRELGGTQDSLVPFLVVRLTEQDVVAQGGIQDPWSLGGVCDAAGKLDGTGLQDGLIQDGRDQRALSAGNATDDCAELSGLNVDGDVGQNGFRVFYRHGG
mmetsp:Transcript_17285/g.48681  ORF Transcript_17285/g.48681 Transcript_17285/m.48681 type:complete len:214 (-) Transcript_17285:1226-1867(-)